MLGDSIEKLVDDLNNAYERLRRVDPDDPEGTTAGIASELHDLAHSLAGYAEEYV